MKLDLSRWDDYAFNGWTCNQNSESSANICATSTFSFNFFEIIICEFTKTTILIFSKTKQKYLFKHFKKYLYNLNYICI